MDKDAEELLSRRLTESEPKTEPAEEKAVRNLAPRWEIRIQAEKDPVAEETKIYRKMAEEADGRYDSIKRDGDG